MDESTDLALLDQHLLKTNTLSQQMTAILGQLDARLSRLDKTIQPLGLGPLTRKASSESHEINQWLVLDMRRAIIGGEVGRNASYWLDASEIGGKSVYEVISWGRVEAGAATLLPSLTDLISLLLPEPFVPGNMGPIHSERPAEA